MTRLVFREARSEDDAFIKELAKANDLIVSPGEERLRDHALLWVAAEQADLQPAKASLSKRESLVGFLLAWQVADELQIQDMAVSEASRRRGIATQLLGRLLSEATKSGCTAAYLEVRATNYAAQKLYSAAGFYEVGRRSRYYPGGEDALLFRCCLSGAEYSTLEGS